MHGDGRFSQRWSQIFIKKWLSTFTGLDWTGLDWIIGPSLKSRAYHNIITCDLFVQCIRQNVVFLDNCNKLGCLSYT